ncbi:MAG TPA: hypothetical protein VGR96_12420 [Acidobacteriaceae bacterium]|nr:hypothetical protein [Acidobacteriaceae bacterium]
MAAGIGPGVCRPRSSKARSGPLCGLAVCILALSCLPSSGAQVSSASAVSSDDITVADGLQLPSYGHVWVLDSWKGVQELVQLHRPDEAATGSGFSLEGRHVIEVKGEAASIRLHRDNPQIFLRGVTGSDAETRSDFVLVPVTVHGRNREAAKDAWSAINSKHKGKDLSAANIIELSQERIGETDWYRLWAAQPLGAGEYVMVPRPNTPGAALDEIYDFAVDPEAQENLRAVRSDMAGGR